MEYWMDPYPLIAMLSSFLYEVAQAKKNHYLEKNN